MTKEMKFKLICEELTSSPCIGPNFLTIKEQFRNDIKSDRRFDHVVNIEELVKLLQKRDYVNLENITALKLIAVKLNRQEVVHLIDNYESVQVLQNSPDVVLIKRNNTNNERIVNRVLPDVSSDLKARVYDLISEDIGHKWKEFARALNVREGKIDTLDNSYRNISDSVREVLLFHEQNCDKRKWQSNLLEALTKARRNDLRNEVQNIFDTHQ